MKTTKNTLRSIMKKNSTYSASIEQIKYIIAVSMACFISTILAHWSASARACANTVFSHLSDRNFDLCNCVQDKWCQLILTCFCFWFQCSDIPVRPAIKQCTGHRSGGKRQFLTLGKCLIHCYVPGIGGQGFNWLMHKNTKTHPEKPQNIISATFTDKAYKYWPRN